MTGSEGTSRRQENEGPEFIVHRSSFIVLGLFLSLLTVASADPAGQTGAPDSVKPNTVRPASPEPVTRIGPRAAATAPTRAGRPGRTVRPGTAVLLSALIPGAGQFYTGNYLKGTLLGAAELTLGGLTIRAHQQGNNDLRNTLLWWTGFAWGFSMADAYVSAAMYGFKEEQRLEARMGPATVGIAYRF
jgi:hypothetical protein